MVISMLDTGRKIDIVIPSLGHPHLKKCLASLEHIPFEYELRVIRKGTSWSSATNIGFADSDRDVILMDDDVELLPETFATFEQYYDKADIFGFKLLYGNGRIQHSGGTVSRRNIVNSQEDRTEPLYLGHVTTSLCFIKRPVIEATGGMAEDYPGLQFEDVDFSFRAQDLGFKILYLPFPAYHYESLTKKKVDTDFFIKSTWNLAELKKRFGYDFSRFMGITRLE